MYFNKKFFILSVVCILIVCLMLSSVAVSDNMDISKPVNIDGKNLICVSYRGDTAGFPKNSVEGILSAKSKGADMVSVSVLKTKDGVFVLCEDESLGNVCNAPYESIGEVMSEQLNEYNLYDSFGNLTEHRMSTAEELLNKTDSSLHLIFDIRWEDKDGIYELVRNAKALDRVSLRTKEGAKKITKWTSGLPEKINVIGVYDGNIIFNAISHVNTLSKAGMTMVQYQSKNYFNVFYGSWVTDNFAADGKAIAIAPTYSPDLCGQRSDSELGWDEIIKKGFTAIETNNIEAFVAYAEKNEQMRKSLAELIGRAEKIDLIKYSIVSKENLTDAMEYGKSVLEGRIKSLNEVQHAYSSLLFSVNEMKIATGEETTKGALNITAGKIIATVLVGAGLFAAQIFVHKMHKKKS